MKPWTIPVLVAASAFAFAATAAPGSAQARAENIVRLRSDVESLSEDIRRQRESARARQTALVSEKQELIRQLHLAEIEQKTLRKISVDKSSQEDNGQKALDAAVVELRQVIAGVRQAVASTCPVHIGKRLDRLAALDAKLSGQAPDLAVVVEELWQFLEDEEELTREVSALEEIVDWDGEKRLVQVVHFGMSIMYVLDDQKVGRVQCSSGPRSVEPLTQAKDEELIRDIFERVERGERELRILLPAGSLSTTSVPTTGSGAPQ